MLLKLTALRGTIDMLCRVAGYVPPVICIPPELIEVSDK